MGRLSTAGEADEVKRASPLELFFDLVFVFALAQVTVLMADAGDWAGIHVMRRCSTFWNGVGSLIIPVTENGRIDRALHRRRGASSHPRSRGNSSGA
jgi:hypothetical protein